MATNGSDANSGTPEKPFATLAKAQEAVHGRIAAGLDADLTVLIRGGTYRIEKTLSRSAPKTPEPSNTPLPGPPARARKS